MPINNGVIENYVPAPTGGITARVYYDNTVGVNADGSIDATAQNVINGPGGFACEFVNTSPSAAQIEITGPSGKFLGPDGSALLTVPAGTTGYTAQQLRTRAGIRTRADVLGFALSSP